ncbi:hypothetical protein D3C78_1316130 [compost metagenome]
MDIGVDPAWGSAILLYLANGFPYVQQNVRIEIVTTLRYRVAGEGVSGAKRAATIGGQALLQLSLGNRDGMQCVDKFPQLLRQPMAAFAANRHLPLDPTAYAPVERVACLRLTLRQRNGNRDRQITG